MLLNYVSCTDTPTLFTEGQSSISGVPLRSDEGCEELGRQIHSKMPKYSGSLDCFTRIDSIGGQLLFDTIEFSEEQISADIVLDNELVIALSTVLLALAHCNAVQCIVPLRPRTVILRVLFGTGDVLDELQAESRAIFYGQEEEHEKVQISLNNKLVIALFAE